MNAEQVLQRLRTRPVTTAAGVLEAATTRVKLLLQQLALIEQHISEAKHAMEALLASPPRGRDQPRLLLEKRRPILGVKCPLLDVRRGMWRFFPPCPALEQRCWPRSSRRYPVCSRAEITGASVACVASPRYATFGKILAGGPTTSLSSTPGLCRLPLESCGGPARPHQQSEVQSPACARP